MGYRVTAPYVTVRTMTENGPRIIGLYKGAVVPDDAAEDWIEAHTRDQLIEEFGAEAAPVSAESVPAEETPPAKAEASAENKAETGSGKSGSPARPATASRTGKGE